MKWKFKNKQMASPRALPLRPLMELKLVLSRAQKPDSLQRLMHHLIFYTSQMDMDIPLRGKEYHAASKLYNVPEIVSLMERFCFGGLETRNG